MAYTAVAVCFLIATAACSYASFKAGYDVGWEERHREMILPRKIIERNTFADDDAGYHSAIDPKKGVWH